MENQNTNNNLMICVLEERFRDKAEKLADQLQVKLIRDWSEAKPENLVLRLDSEGIALVRDKMILQGDFTQMLPRLRNGFLQRELLVRAAKPKGITGIPTAVDATAGLGEDAILLAASGFSVQLYEYDPIIALLLQDALDRAAEVPELKSIVSRMKLFSEDSITALHNLKEKPDFILLDPMFPARQKSALIKKKFQLLQQLESPCTDEEELLNAAIAAGPRKIAIKRPIKAPCLANHKPDYSIKSKVIRYDCLVFPRT